VYGTVSVALHKLSIEYFSLQVSFFTDAACIFYILTSVADPDPNPDPPDPHVFGPPGSRSGSICERYGSGSRSFYHEAK
jgi:hypothetical protein